MAVKPWNVQSVLRDRLVKSELVTLAAASGTTAPLYVDDLYDWQVESALFYPVAPYIAAQAVTVSVGQVGTAGKFVNAASMGAAAVAAGVKVPLALSATVRLRAGNPLIASWVQNASQTGTGVFVVRLRPYYARYSGTKRSRNATSPT